MLRGLNKYLITVRWHRLTWDIPITKGYKQNFLVLNTFTFAIIQAATSLFGTSFFRALR